MFLEASADVNVTCDDFGAEDGDSVAWERIVERDSIAE
jgi:hypothetical protein